MAMVLNSEQVEEGIVDISTEPVVTLGNHRLRARQNKVDYCELIDKPEQLYRLVPASKLPKNMKVKFEDASNERQIIKAAESSDPGKEIIPIPEPVVPEHVPVQLPEQFEPWPVWIKHTEKDLIAYALWINAVDMMKDPDVPGRFLLCFGPRYKPIRNAQPCASIKLSDQVELMRPSNYRQCIKLGKAFVFPSGQTFEEGSPILKVLQHAWPPGAIPAKAYVGNTYLPGGVRRNQMLGLIPRVRPAKAHKLRLASYPKASHLPESGEPVRVHATWSRHKVYGLWTNAQAAIEACRPGPLMFVQCEQDTYERINPEVKCRNDRFYMLAGGKTCGGWRNRVQLDQELSIPGGSTFKVGTRLTQVFETLLKLRSEQAIDQAPGDNKEGGNKVEEAFGNADEQITPDKGAIVVYNEQQDAITCWEVIVIDNSPKKKANIRNNSNRNSKASVRGRGQKRRATALASAARPSKRGKNNQHESVPQSVTSNKTNAKIPTKAAKPGKTKSNNNGSCIGGKKRLASASQPESNKVQAKRAKNGGSRTSIVPAKQGKNGNTTPNVAALQQPCSKPATARGLSESLPVVQAVPVKKEVTDIVMADALPEQDTQQQFVLVSLPPLSVDSQFKLETDCARQLLEALASLLKSLNYGEQQAKQLWRGYKRAFLKDGISRACTNRKQQWATNYLQLIDAVESGDLQSVRSVLEDLFEVVT